ncbi:MAG: hypothetical protein AMXMBFR13_13420 [Phycisphaerae bacterium]
MSKSSIVAAAVACCALITPGYGQVIGNWEGTMDGWALWGTAPAGTTATLSTTGVTLGSSALKVTPAESGHHTSVYVTLNSPALREAFFNNSLFVVDLTRIAAEWAGPATTTNGIHIIINAGASASGPKGVAWAIYEDLGWRNSWDHTQGNLTAAAVWDYTAAKDLVDADNLEWLELIIVTNFADTYTTTGSYYLDNAHFEPPLPEPPILGDWENRTDSWYPGGGGPAFSYSGTSGVTLHSYSLKTTYGGAGWRQGPYFGFENKNAAIDAFLANDVFSVDVTRLASEWVRGTGDHYCQISAFVNAGFSDGTANIWGDLGAAGPWSSLDGDRTQTLSWTYTPYKSTIAAHRSAISWFQLVLVLNTGGYTGGFMVYWDNARLSPPPPQPQGFYTFNTFDTADEATQWTVQNANEGPPTVLEWDPTVDADVDDGNANPTPGSLKVTVTWDPDNPPQTWQSLVGRDVFPDIIGGVNLTDYNRFRVRMKVDPNSAPFLWGSFGWANWIFRSSAMGWAQWAGSGANLDNDGPMVVNGWQTFDVHMSGEPEPVPPRSNFRALTYQLGGEATDAEAQVVHLDGTTTFWIDNVRIGRMRPCQDPLHCELCDNFADDNGDTLIDCEDADCPGTLPCPLETNCPDPPNCCRDGFDGLDEDGLIDCHDPDCDDDPYCARNDPFADMDGDQDVDQGDFGLVQPCLNTFLPFPMGCGFLDRNNDHVINGADLMAFEACASGPRIQADTACDDAQ